MWPGNTCTIYPTPLKVNRARIGLWDRDIPLLGVHHLGFHSLIDKEFLNHIKLKLVVQFLFFPIFWGYSYFVLFLNKNLLFSYFLFGEAKICKNIENEIIVVLCFRVRFIIKQVVCWLWCSNISKNNSYICSFHDLYCPLKFCEQLCYNY